MIGGWEIVSFPTSHCGTSRGQRPLDEPRTSSSSRSCDRRPPYRLQFLPRNLTHIFRTTRYTTTAVVAWPCLRPKPAQGPPFTASFSTSFAKHASCPYSNRAPCHPHSVLILLQLRLWASIGLEECPLADPLPHHLVPLPITALSLQSVLHQRIPRPPCPYRLIMEMSMLSELKVYGTQLSDSKHGEYRSVLSSWLPPGRPPAS